MLVIVDVLLAIVAGVAGGWLEISRAGQDAGYLVAAQVVAAGMLLLRRRRPFTAALSIAAISLFVPAWATFFMPYAVIVHGRGRRQWAVIAALTVAFLVGARAWTIDDPFSAPAVILISTLLGLYVRARRNLLAEHAGKARADERIRLAGEMHDVVTHRINLIVLQAGALRVSTTDPDARAAAEQLRVAGCEVLAELRDLVGVLRDGDGSPVGVTEQAGEVKLASLVSESRAAGLPVRLVEDGDLAAVAPTVRRTLFRVVQESLTNVHKHAPGADATVSVRYGRDSLHATVSNTPRRRAADPELTAAGSGSGLDGLRHRVEVVGGTLTAGPEPGGGFTVSATLPMFVST